MVDRKSYRSSVIVCAFLPSLYIQSVPRCRLVLSLSARINFPRSIALDGEVFGKNSNFPREYFITSFANSTETHLFQLTPYIRTTFFLLRLVLSPPFTSLSPRPIRTHPLYRARASRVTVRTAAKYEKPTKNRRKTISVRTLVTVGDVRRRAPANR